MTAINSNRAIRGPVTAVPVVAGKGVRLTADTENNRWVVEADETVLWSGTRYWWSDTSDLQLSEAASNFEVIRVKVKDDWAFPHKFIFFPGNNTGFDVSLIGCEGGSLTIKTSKFSVSGSTVSLAEKFLWQFKTDKTVNANTDTSFIQFSEIVGINRIASN